MKVLVTGGAGFIGSNIVKKILARNDSVRIVDNLSTGSLSNLTDCIDDVEFINGDISNIDLALSVTKGIDYVLHHAALPSVLRSVEDPIQTNEINVLGTLNMLISARDNGVKRFVYAGSSSVYGDLDSKYKVESMPTNPKSPYAIQKLAGEEYCKVFFRLYGLETITFRYFNVFGPNQSFRSEYSAVIPKFVNMFLHDKSPTIYGDGSNSRDFTFVDNVVSANLIACDTSNKASFGEVFNIACGKSISLNDLVYKICNVTGKKISSTYSEGRPADVKSSLADISKASRILGYKPLVGFDEGLKTTINWIKSLT
ncbi:LPS biosynthesis protein WbpP [candidate division WWE3 bacterium CG_4_9_14_0_2_um_filter_35_11]|uniref:LPS biosynthesis protein WbpP n=1 Tax=candidate division WWE3 bacterium CG_4_9_14_0_2_um_filter_35_11 TaxID=1975077 RepID=A0A2M8ELN4_UNCKA|nr:MAG: LPS biosynthesis protein WbpP [candidate division WWE3 bacterium CG10_big_fil_rev_8_21_14_0_10_35_32]PJC23641.1 MAG: LPS biosynthesis protein WbpP [candidate division WWE3 bacterium CG_4_9_14_0_2_um_filter_35_11]